MKKLDRSAMEILGISEDVLMENASLASYEVLKKNRKLSEDNILVVAGCGNNGGDGLALARKLYASGYKVDILLVDGSGKYGESAMNNYKILRKFPVEIWEYDKIENKDGLFENYSLIIDGIFGISLDREVEGKYKKIIDEINESRAEVMSLDIPSGICSNSGKAMGVAVDASYTVAYGGLKWGNILYEGCEYCGKLYYSNISVPDFLAENIDSVTNMPKRLPKRNPESHKGTFGKVMFIGGGSQYYGAPYLNSVAFLKSGGAYSRLACPSGIVKSLAIKASEVVYYPMKETNKGNLSIENLKNLLDNGKNMDFMVIGGGMSLEEEAQRLTQILISKLECPILVDADGLTALSEKMDVLYARKAPTILTPHLGEMSRLTGMSIENIKADIVGTAVTFAKKYRVILVLKGARTLIVCPDGRVILNTSGSSALAVAGSGDILAGMIAGQFALGFGVEDAVSMGVFLHGCCGDIIGEAKGAEGVMAEDILEAIPMTLKKFKDNFEYFIEKYSVEEV
jgi:NAD(P)H-hydrate epimerase